MMEYTAMAMVVVEERTVATEVWERMMRSATFSVVFSMVLCAMPEMREPAMLTSTMAL
tara:strand:+ start:14523 stop:14696 length:174 start_codon:yes stop_codon:yes gene_type:complete